MRAPGSPLDLMGVVYCPPVVVFDHGASEPPIAGLLTPLIIGVMLIRQLGRRSVGLCISPAISTY